VDGLDSTSSDWGFMPLFGGNVPMVGTIPFNKHKQIRDSRGFGNAENHFYAPFTEISYPNRALVGTARPSRIN